MDFWERIFFLAERNNCSRKELAELCGYKSVSSFSKGPKNNSFPRADMAVKIASRLHTTVEYLVTGKDPRICQNNQVNIDLYYKYKDTIENLEIIPEEPRKPIETVISDSCKQYKKSSPTETEEKTDK